MRNTARFWTGLFSAVLVFSGCAHSKPAAEIVDPAAMPVLANAEATDKPLSDLPITSSVKPVSSLGVSSENSSGREETVAPIGSYKQIDILLPLADIMIQGVAPTPVRRRLKKKGVQTAQAEDRQRGNIRIEVIQGPSTCKVSLLEQDEKLVVTEAAKETVRARFKSKLDVMIVSAAAKRSTSSLPGHGNCQYRVEMLSSEPNPVEIQLQRGSVFVENWSKPLKVKMMWGDLDVSGVGALDVTCGDCTLTGSGVEGALKFAMGTGNVGVDGLTGSVEGRTLGDTILKWKKVKSDSVIKVASQAGDVILAFPNKIPLALDLKVPRGDIYSKLTPSDSGIPVSVEVEQGNLRLLHR